MQPGGLKATVDSRRAWERGEETGRQSAGAAARAEVGKAYGEKGLCKVQMGFFPGPQWTADSNLVEFPIESKDWCLSISLPAGVPEQKYSDHNRAWKGKLLEETTGQEGLPWVSLSWFQTVGQPDLLPFPLNRWLPWQCPLFPGPVVSSKSSFTFFFCFPLLFCPTPTSFPDARVTAEEIQEQGKQDTVPRQSRGLWGAVVG